MYCICGFDFIMMILVIFVSVVSQLATTYGAVESGKRCGETCLSRDCSVKACRISGVCLGLYFIFGGAWMLIWFGFMAVIIGGSMLTMGLATIMLLCPFSFGDSNFAGWLFGFGIGTSRHCCR